MSNRSDALQARWRRLTQHLAEVIKVQDSAGHSLPDAVSDVLNDTYDLWDMWAKDRTPALTTKQQDDAVRGDPDGETTAALVWARGAKTHAFVEWGEVTTGYAPTYRPNYWWWHWQSYSEPGTRWPDRDDWYGQHVAGKPVLAPLQAAERWLRTRQELR